MDSKMTLCDSLLNSIFLRLSLYNKLNRRSDQSNYSMGTLAGGHIDFDIKRYRESKE